MTRTISALAQVLQLLLQGCRVPVGGCETLGTHVRENWANPVDWLVDDREGRAEALQPVPGAQLGGAHRGREQQRRGPVVAKIAKLCASRAKGQLSKGAGAGLPGAGLTSWYDRGET